MKNLIALLGYPFLVLALIVLAASSLFIIIYYLLSSAADSLFNLKINNQWRQKS